MSDTPTKTLESVDIHGLLELLPHRFPMLLVDKIVDIDGDEAGIGIKNVTFNEPQFQGHFPGQPVMPGVTIVEAMAQTAAVVVGVSLDLADRGMRTYFMAIDKVKFRRMVVPGDVLELHVTVKRGGGKIWKFEGQGIVDGEIACEAEFTAMMDQPAREAADG